MDAVKKVAHAVEKAVTGFDGSENKGPDMPVSDSLKAENNPEKIAPGTHDTEYYVKPPAGFQEKNPLV